MSHHIFIDKVVLALQCYLEDVSSHDIKNKMVNSNVIKTAKHICLSNQSKRIRSHLIYLVSDTLSLPEDTSIRLALSAELIHAASLLHDDVIDASMMRRKKETANVLYGNTIAVLTGDLLYSYALTNLLPFSKDILKNSIDVVTRMTMAATLEYNHRGNVNLKNADWIQIANGKTSQLFAWCLRTPALINPNNPLTTVFYDVGVLIGYIFQLADDIKDFMVSREEKDIYLDIRNQNPNYILMTAMSQSPEIKQDVQDVWNEMNNKKTIPKQRYEEIGRKVIHSQALKVAVRQIKSWLQDIQHTLELNQQAPLSQSLIQIFEEIYQKHMIHLPT